MTGPRRARADWDWNWGPGSDWAAAATRSSKGGGGALGSVPGPTPPAGREETEVDVGDPRALTNALSWGTPQLLRLRQLVAELTVDDRIDDPFLDELLLPLTGDPLALRHARMTILRGRRLPARRSESVGDFRGAVGHLLRSDVPAARLLLDAKTTYLLPRRQRDRIETGDADDVHLAPAAAPLLIGRDDAVYAFDPPPKRMPPRRSGWEATRPGSRPDFLDDDEDDEEVDSAVHVARWEEAYAGWSVRHERERRARDAHFSALERGLGAPLTDPLDADWLPRLANHLAERPVYVPGTWDAEGRPASENPPGGKSFAELDTLMGTVWLALRRVAHAAEMVELPTGERLVAIGGGLCVAVDVRRHLRRGGTVDVRAAFGSTMGEGGVFSPVAAAVQRAEHTPSVELPASVYITGVGLALSARFLFSPWLTETPTSSSSAEAILRHSASLLDDTLD